MILMEDISPMYACANLESFELKTLCGLADVVRIDGVGDDETAASCRSLQLKRINKPKFVGNRRRAM